MAATTASTTFYTAQAGNYEYYNGGKGGKERVMQIYHACTAQEAASTIKLCKLPKGAIVTGMAVCSEANTASSTMTFKVGSTAVSSALASSSALNQEMDKLYALLGAALTADTDITILTGGATLTAGKKLLVTVRFVFD